MKGFTLIELLAVIVILAIILVIAVPQINKTITDSQKRSFESDTKIVLSQLDINTLDKTLDILSIDATNIESILGIKDDNYDSVKLTKIDGEAYILIKGKNKWNGLMAYGTYNNITVSTDTTYNTILSHMGYNSTKGVNEPILSKGMTPIKWDGTKWISTTEDDTDWYDYTNKIWANAKTQDGSMWVWIPRYIYKITSGWHSNTTGTIEVQFSMGTDDTINNSVTLDTGTSSDASNNKWTNHPGFTFGSTELTGIWIAKFEASASEGVVNGYTANSSCPIAGDNVTTKTIKVIPNATSWRCINAGNMFTVTRNMETNAIYGWGTTGTNIDTHLMKNIEWGIVAYVSKSTYGKNTIEVYPNNALTYTTGCSANSITQGTSETCQNTYESTNGVQASTTGNIYGIYDMSGGTWERVSAYVNNENSTLTSYALSMINADNKYKDIYTVGTTDDQTNNYALAINQKGDAIYETSNNISGTYSWFNDYSNMPNTDSPSFIRGGKFDYTNSNGLFNFYVTSAGAFSGGGFRSVLLVGKGL